MCVSALVVVLLGLVVRRRLLFIRVGVQLRPMLSRCRVLALLTPLDSVTLEARTVWVPASTCPLFVDKLRLLMLCRVRLCIILVTPPILLAVTPLIPSPQWWD